MCKSLVVLFVIAAAANAQSGNIAANPGFEQVTATGGPAHWTAPPTTYRVTDKSPRGGARCLRYDNDDADRYTLAVATIPFEVGQRFSFEAYIRTRDIVGDDSGATICMQWWTKDGQFLGGSYPTGIKGTHGNWQHIGAVTPPIPDNADRVEVLCYVRRGMTGTAWWDDVAVRTFLLPLVDGVTTDIYRGETIGESVNVIAGLQLAAHKLKPGDVDVKLRIVDEAGEIVELLLPATIDQQVATWRFDTTHLPVGEYTLECVAQARDDKQGIATCTLRRLEQLPPRIAFIDQHHRMILRGKPFFPLGTYWGSVSEEHMTIYADSPFNCIMPYAALDRATLDIVHAHGVNVIYSIKDYYAGSQYVPAAIKTPDDERSAIEAKLKQIGDHPAIIAWYINDELPLTLVDRLTAHQQWMEQLDPSRPTWVVLFQIGDVRAYLPTFDVIGTDPYPVPNKPINMPLDYTRRTVDATFGRRAVWMVPQIFNWASYREARPDEGAYRSPTLDEMRSMAWQCIAGGANGLVFYSWHDLWRRDPEEPFADRWADVTTMAGEIERLIPVLLSIDEPAAMTNVDTPDAIACRLFAYQGATWLFAVNADREHATATCTFDTAFAAATLELGQSDAKLNRNVVTLDFAPLEVKVVRLEPAR